MSKPLPYYPMYVYDFDEDKNVVAMSAAEVGVYLLALNESWKRGSIPDDATALAVMIRKKPAEVKKAWAAVRACWVSNGKPGQLINPRQEKERQRSREISEVRADAARTSHLPSSRRFDDPKSLHVHLQANESESVSVSGLEAEEPTNTATGARGKFVDFETFFHRWKQHRGFKKPQKHLIERAALGWEKVQIDEDDLVLALDGYFTSDWARKENYPILGFVKDPHSWIVRAALAVESLPAPIDLPAPTVEPLAPTAARIDYPARWNELVPARPVTWDPYRGDANSLRNCESDPVFRERFDEMCCNAQRLHQERGKAVEWITFEFAIRTNGKGKGWWRILEEMKPSAPKVQKKSLADIMGMGKKETKNVHSGV